MPTRPTFSILCCIVGSKIEGTVSCLLMLECMNVINSFTCGVPLKCL